MTTQQTNRMTAAPSGTARRRSRATREVPRRTFYVDTVRNDLMKEFGYRTVMEDPKLEKSSSTGRRRGPRRMARSSTPRWPT